MMNRRVKGFMVGVSVVAMVMVPQMLAGAECSHPNPVQGAVSLPTCDQDGYYEVICNDCGDLLDHVTTPAFGHSFGEWTVVQDASCESPGSEYRVCQECDEEESREIPITEHDFGDWSVITEPTCNTKGEAYRLCLNGCLTEETKEIPATGKHEFDNGLVIQEATCTHEGITRYTCKTCKTTEDKKTDALSHQFMEWKIVKDATDSSKGQKSRMCMICAYEEWSEFFPEGTLVNGDHDMLAVYVLQELLIDQGYLQGDADGSFGNMTEKAVREVQKENKFEETGIAYPQTIHALMKKWLEKMEKNNETESVLGTNIDVVRTEVEIEVKDNAQAVATKEMKTQLEFKKADKTYKWIVK